MMKGMALLAATVAVVLTLGCESTVRKTMYSAYETVGIEKRDILRRRVDTARDEQKDASETFQDALETFKKMYKFDGGKLERQYDKAKSAYEKSASQAKDVRESIESMNQVAGDLFKEWEKEAAQMESADLRAKSLDLRRTTQKKYEGVYSTLKKSEARMEPILRKLSDQVTFLKHNLNAKALASLHGESANIEKEIERFLKDAQVAMNEADGFIAELK